MVERISKALGMGVGALATEHFFTFTLSSLPTTKKFFRDDEEGKRDVYGSLAIATVLSIAFGSIMSYILKDPISFATCLILSIIFVILYMRALEGKIP